MKHKYVQGLVFMHKKAFNLRLFTVHTLFLLPLTFMYCGGILGVSNRGAPVRFKGSGSICLITRGITIFRHVLTEMLEIPPNTRLICTENQDPGPHTGKFQGRAKKTNIFGLILRKPGFFVFGLMLFLLPVSVAQAGILSFFENLFSGGTTESFDRNVNSQNANILQAAINADPNPSKGGGDITIVGDSALLPDVGPLGTLADIEDGGSSARSDQVSVYVVRAGDSLSQIAKIFGVNVNTIRWANDIGTNGVIHEGQTLVILPVSGVRYTVEKGDTISTIAKHFGGEAQEILDFNGITIEDTLSVGEILVIPGGEVPTTSGSGIQYAAVVKGTGAPSYEGYYIWPVQGGRKTQGLHGYNAVDIGAPYGTPVFASASGEVIVSRFSEGNPWFGGYGNYIVVKHNNGTQTLYAHLSKTIVSRGWNVVQGQVIGYVGSTGRSTGSHLHFEVRGAKNPF